MSHSTESFRRLQDLGFYPDILGSLVGFMRFMHNKGQCTLGQKIAEIFASGYLTVKEFNVNELAPAEGDEFYDLKTRYLAAIGEIHKRFGDRLPRQFYETLAFTVKRSNPTKEERIPDLEHLLPEGMNWMVADAVLHAMPLCSRLYFDVQTRINQETGMILGHGCGCSHSISGMTTCVINAPMGKKDEIMFEETESFLRHVLGQYYLLQFGLPQGMGASVKMRLHDLRDEVPATRELIPDVV